MLSKRHFIQRLSESTISCHNSLVPWIGQSLKGPVDHVFAFSKQTTDKFEGVYASSPSLDVIKERAIVYVSYFGSYDARMAYAADQHQRPAL